MEDNNTENVENKSDGVLENSEQVVENNQIVETQEEIDRQVAEPQIVSEQQIAEPQIVSEQQVVEQQVVTEPQIVNSTNNLSNGGDIPKKKFPVGALIGGLVGVIVLGIVLFVGGTKLLISDKKVVEKELTSIFQSARKVMKESKSEVLDYDLEKDSLGLTGSLKIESNYKDDDIDLTKLKNYKITYSAVFDKNGNQASGALALEKNNPILGLDFYASRDKAYVVLAELYKKTITTTLDEEIKDMKFTEVKEEDLEKVLKKTEEVTKNFINDKDISKSKEKKKINGSEKEYNKISYKLNVQDYLIKLSEEYRSDDEILEILADLSNVKKYEMKDNLKDLEEDLKDADKTEITINTYTDGFMSTVKEVEIFMDEGNSIVIDKVDNKDLITVYVEKEKFITGEYDEANRSLKLEYDNSGIKVGIDANFKDKHESTVSIKAQQDEMKVNIDVVRKGTIKKDSQIDEVKVDFNYKDSDNNIKFSLTNNSELTKNGKVNKLDTDNTIDIDDISEDELMDILRKAGEKLEDLINDIAPGYMDVAEDYLAV